MCRASQKINEKKKKSQRNSKCNISLLQVNLQSISCFTRATPCFIDARGPFFSLLQGKQKKLRKRLIFQLDVQRAAPLLGTNANAFCLFVCLQPWEFRLLHIIWRLLLSVCLTPETTTASTQPSSGCGWAGGGGGAGGGGRLLLSFLPTLFARQWVTLIQVSQCDSDSTFF